MSQLSTGNPAPDLTLQTVDGETVRLSQLWPEAKSTLIIFLRHLA